MVCSKCGASNPDHAKCCGQCGTALTQPVICSDVQNAHQLPVAPPPPELQQKWAKDTDDALRRLSISKKIFIATVLCTIVQAINIFRIGMWGKLLTDTMYLRGTIVPRIIQVAIVCIKVLIVLGLWLIWIGGKKERKPLQVAGLRVICVHQLVTLIIMMLMIIGFCFSADDYFRQLWDEIVVGLIISPFYIFFVLIVFGLLIIGGVLSYELLIALGRIEKALVHSTSDIRVPKSAVYLLSLAACIGVIGTIECFLPDTPVYRVIDSIPFIIRSITFCLFAWSLASFGKTLQLLENKRSTDTWESVYYVQPTAPEASCEQQQ